MNDAAKIPNGSLAAKVKNILYEEITAELGKSTGGNITVDYGYAVQRIITLLHGEKK